MRLTPGFFDWLTLAHRQHRQAEASEERIEIKDSQIVGWCCKTCGIVKTIAVDADLSEDFITQLFNQMHAQLVRAQMAEEESGIIPICLARGPERLNGEEAMQRHQKLHGD